LLRWWNAGALAFVVFSFGACSHDDGDNVLDVVHDACAPIAVSVTEPSVETEVQAQGVRDAFALWNAHGLPDMGIAASDGAVVELRFESAAEAFHGVYDDEHGVIYINSKITEPHALAVTIAHELGHSMGLWHTTGEPSIMNPGNTSIEPQPDDIARLQALWGVCPTSSALRPGS
jgi:hypothetical protein